MSSGDLPGRQAMRWTDPGWLPVQMNWVSWLWAHLNGLGDAIRQQLGREPDDGDLLIALGSARDSLTGRALRDAGVDVDDLAATVKRLRSQAHEADPLTAAEAIRQQKERAKEAGDSPAADRLREEERRLTDESRQAHRAALNGIHRRLDIDQWHEGPTEP